MDTDDRWTAYRVREDLPLVPVKLATGEIVEGKLSREDGTFANVWVHTNITSSGWVAVGSFSFLGIATILNNSTYLLV